MNPENQRSNYVRGLINGYSGNYQAAVDDFKNLSLGSRTNGRAMLI